MAIFFLIKKEFFLQGFSFWGFFFWGRCYVNFWSPPPPAPKFFFQVHAFLSFNLLATLEKTSAFRPNNFFKMLFVCPVSLPRRPSLICGQWVKVFDELGKYFFGLLGLPLSSII